MSNFSFKFEKIRLTGVALHNLYYIPSRNGESQKWQQRSELVKTETSERVLTSGSVIANNPSAPVDDVPQSSLGELPWIY